MSDDKLHRHEIAPGCWIVSSEGTSRSGDTMADTVRAICEGADRRSARPVTYAQARAACVARWGDGRELTDDGRFVEWRFPWTWPRRLYLGVDGARVYLMAVGVANAPTWTLAGDGDVTPLPDALDAADAFLRTTATTAAKGP